jgi:hypothetical protein
MLSKMLYKTTTRLFKSKYQYKLVITCAGASWFRGGDMDTALDHLKKINLNSSNAATMTWGGRRPSGIKTQEDLDYAFKLQKQLKKLKDIDVRVETPWISVYSNSESDINSIIKIDEERIKYVCVPPDKTQLDSNTIIMPKINYEFRVTMGKTTQEHSAFVSWAEKNPKVKLTKSCAKELSRDRSWGGTFFYITGENNLLMAKMHLGSSINKIERIIKP